MTAVFDDLPSLVRRHADVAKRIAAKQAERELARKELADRHGVKTVEGLESLLEAVRKKLRKRTDKYLADKRRFEERLAKCVEELDESK